MQPKLRIEICISAWVLAIVVGLSLVGAERRAEAGESEVLAGLFGVQVIVEKISRDAERDGLREAILQTAVELRLRQAGVRVLTETQSKRAPGQPYLYVKVSTYKRRGTLYAYSTDVELKELIRLDRAPSVKEWATTWSARGHIGTVGAEKVYTLRDDVEELVDQFINAYLAANPKR